MNLTSDNLTPLAPEQRCVSNFAARQRLAAAKGEPVFLSDWVRALFIHFEVDAAELQSHTPFRLDLHEGRAYVSLVAFTMRRLRPRRGGRVAEWCFKPIEGHELLNLRTYVRHGGEAGIYFLAEWIPNRLSAFLGPRTFGLPYRLGRLEYQHSHETNTLRGSVQDLVQPGRELRLEYSASLSITPPQPPAQCPSPAPPAALGRTVAAGSLDEFLLERYTAFTQRGSKARFFRVWHQPWLQVPAQISLFDNSLFHGFAECFRTAKQVRANYSPGVENVWMGRPRPVERVRPVRSVLSAFYQIP